ncbi:pectin methylesterase-like acyl-CoA thioesterase [Xanthomonas arboricola]
MYRTDLGRAWDEGVGSSLSAYVNGSSPNGQVTVRNSSLGSHIRKTAPCNASTVSRPYCSSTRVNSANRCYGYGNSGAGSADRRLPHQVIRVAGSQRVDVATLACRQAV